MVISLLLCSLASLSLSISPCFLHLIIFHLPFCVCVYMLFSVCVVASGASETRPRRFSFSHGEQLYPDRRRRWTVAEDLRQKSVV